MTTHKAPTLLQNAGRTIVNGRRINKRSRDELIALVFTASNELNDLRGAYRRAISSEGSWEGRYEEKAVAFDASQSSLKAALRDLTTVRLELVSMENACNLCMEDCEKAGAWIAEWESRRWRVAFAWVALALSVGSAAFIWGCNVGTKWLAWVWDLL